MLQMDRNDFKAVAAEIVLILTASSLSFGLFGCATPLSQQALIVKVAPVSEKYKLTQRLEGNVYILLAEASTGQEQHRYAVSDSLARAIKKRSKDSDELTDSDLSGPALQKKGKAGKREKSSDGYYNLEILSFTDLANKINEKDVSQRYSEMRDFYQKNGMFRKSDIEFLAKEIGPGYFILPCLLDVNRWGTSRLSIFGLKVINTQIICVVVSMEIWDGTTGHKVFSATSDVTISSERIRENPISIDEALESAWLGVIEELRTPH